MKCGFHHVALKVKDFDNTFKFYKEVLGLQEKIVWEMDGALAAMLLMDDGGIVEIFGGGTDGAEANARWPHLAIKVDDVPGTYKKALDFGAKSHIEPNKVHVDGNGGKSMDLEIAFVHGMGGELLEFIKES